MAKSRQCLGIDIGAHSIRVADLSLSPKGIEIKKLAEHRLELEPGQKESVRQAAIVQQLSALLKANKIKTRQAVFCVPGQTVFVRRVRVPATTPDKLERIIRFEAKEQIPFPLEKTTLEYQIFESESPDEVEVLLVAIKRDYINTFMKLVRKTGLKPLAISVSSLALHNFHEINGNEGRLAEAPSKKTESKSKDGKKEKKKGKGFSLSFGKKKKDEEEQEPGEDEDLEAIEADDAFESMELEEIHAEINLGSTIMDLAIPKGGTHPMIGFTRSVPVAGSQIDRAIKSKLGLETMAEAQRVKEEDSVVLAADFEIEGDPDSINQAASEEATRVVDRIVSEMRRSLDFFLSQPDGVAVDAITLSGGLARMRYLSNYVEEKLGLPVELASVKNEKISVLDEEAELVSCFAIPIGLAVQGVGVGMIGIDFLPQDIKNLRAIKEKKGQFAFGAALLLVTIGLSFNAGNRYLQMNLTLADEYESQVSRNEGRSKEVDKIEKLNSQLFKKYEELREARGSTDGQMVVYLTILNSRPSGILFEKVELPQTGMIRISGVAKRQKDISEFVQNLKSGPNQAYIRSASLGADFVGRAQSHRAFQSDVFPFSVDIVSYRRTGRYRPLKGQPPLEAVGATGAAASASDPTFNF